MSILIYCKHIVCDALLWSWNHVGSCSQMLITDFFSLTTAVVFAFTYCLFFSQGRAGDIGAPGSRGEPGFPVSPSKEQVSRIQSTCIVWGLFNTF